MTKELADKVKKLVYNDITIPHDSYIEICRVLEAHIDYPVMQEGKEGKMEDIGYVCDYHVFHGGQFCLKCGYIDPYFVHPSKIPDEVDCKCKTIGQAENCTAPCGHGYIPSPRSKPSQDLDHASSNVV